MKKIVFAALCFMVLATGVFAMEKNIGGGVLYNFGSTSGEIDFGYGDVYDWKLSRNGFGLFGFFFFSQFWELNFGFLYKNPSTLTVDGEKESVSWLDGTAALQLGAYFKYPIPVSDTVVLFPTGGVDFELSFNSDWWHDLWLRGGLGLDFFLSDRMFLRSHLIYGVAIPMASDLDPKIGHGLLIKVGIGFML
jgi:hypothetical protein